MRKKKIREVKDILGSAFEYQLHSLFRRYMIFRADASAVSDEKMSDIIANLLSSGYFPRIFQEDSRIVMQVSSSKPVEKKPRIWINILLFLVTIVTTMMAGSIMVGKDYFVDFGNIFYGWKYSLAILTILTFHEFGHYLSAQYHRIQATLPYYIPLPLPGFHFGTLGAFIRMKSPIQNRRSLLDVGAAGPLAGFVVSIFFLIIGYSILPDTSGIIAFIETIHPMNVSGEGTINIVLGKSLLFAFFNDVIGGGRLPMNEIYHFPYIFAGWIGLLVTAINLIPIGQLDGGHILYALVRQKARLVGILSFSL
ncbi:MAG: site-2 protease family protein, partial [Calditrichaeota bacterium]|nr:site-2 protease family protein [Calditrichota bacterium]